MLELIPSSVVSLQLTSDIPAYVSFLEALFLFAGSDFHYVFSNVIIAEVFKFGSQFRKEEVITVARSGK